MVFRKKDQGKHKLFARYFRAYLAVLIVPLLLSVVIYQIGTYAMREDALELNQSVLEDVRISFEEKKAAALLIPRRFVADTQVRRLAIKNEVTREEYYALNQLVSQLSTYTLYDNVIEDLIVVFNNNETVLYDGGIFSKDEFFGGYFALGDYDRECWEQLLSQPSTGKFYPFQPLALEVRGQGTQQLSDVMLYTQSFGDFQSRYGTYIIVLIDKKQLHQPFQSLNLGDESLLYVLDDQNNVMYTNQRSISVDWEIASEQFPNGASGNFALSIQDEAYTALYSRAATGWKYIALIPDRQLYSDVQYLQMMSMLFLVLGVLMGIALAVYYSQNNVKPIRDIAQILRHTLEEENTPENAWDIGEIRQGVEKISLQNQSLSEQVSLHARELRDRTLYGFLSGRRMGEEEQRMLIHLMEGGGKCRAVLLEISGDSDKTELAVEVQAVCMLLEELFELHKLQAFCLYRSERYICVFREPHETTELYQTLQEILQEFKQEKGITISAGVGGLYPLDQLAVSFTESKIALNAAQTDAVVLFEETLLRHRSDELFPRKIEQQMVALIQSGDVGQVLHLMRVLQEQCKERSDPREESVLCSGLLITLSRVYTEREQPDAKVQQLFQKAPALLVTEHIWSTLEEIAALMCEGSIHMKETVENSFISQIHNIISEQYSDNQLSVSGIADQLGITDKYLSRYYKETTGHNLSDKIESVRMEHAQQLLRQGVGVAQVSEQVGYTNDKSFRRAFKRYYGFAPSNLLS